MSPLSRRKDWKSVSGPTTTAALAVEKRAWPQRWGCWLVRGDLTGRWQVCGLLEMGPHPPHQHCRDLRPRRTFSKWLIGYNTWYHGKTLVLFPPQELGHAFWVHEGRGLQQSSLALTLALLPMTYQRCDPETEQEPVFPECKRDEDLYYQQL